MTSSQLLEVETIFHSAVKCKRDELDSYLDNACGRHESLRQKIEALLASYRQATDFIETLPSALAARLMENDTSSSPIGQHFLKAATFQA